MVCGVTVAGAILGICGSGAGDGERKKGERVVGTLGCRGFGCGDNGCVGATIGDCDFGDGDGDGGWECDDAGARAMLGGCSFSNVDGGI